MVMNYRAPLFAALHVLVAIGLIPRPQRAHDQALTSSAQPVCAVTVPNGSQPPVKNFGGTVRHSPDDLGLSDAPVERSHGNGKLWAVLPPDGKILFRSGAAEKFLWWRGVRGKLSIQGRRLDASAPPLRARIPEGYGDKGFQSTALIFPTEGCWEVTGKAGGASLTFVTKVVRVVNDPR
jgi:hypothetical protein